MRRRGEKRGKWREDEGVEGEVEEEENELYRLVLVAYRAGWGRAERAVALGTHRISKTKLAFNQKIRIERHILYWWLDVWHPEITEFLMSLSRSFIRLCKLLQFDNSIFISTHTGLS